MTKRLAKTAATSREVLANQRITPGCPGSVLLDLQEMLAFLGGPGVATQSGRGNLPAAVLASLNTRLAQPVRLDLKRALLRDYPNIAGLYILLRVLGLVRADTRRVWVDEARHAWWLSLNPTEQYFGLLETWLLHADDEVLGASAWCTFPQFSSNLGFLARRLGVSWKTFPESCHTYSRQGGLSTWNAQLQARFGLIELRPRPLEGRETSTRGWLLKAARRTPWGTAVTWAILNLLDTATEEEEGHWLYADRPPEGADHGFFQPAFQPFFPEWRQLPPKLAPASRGGVFVFKVSMDPRRTSAPVWRRMAVSANAGLDQLATAVLDAFGFYDFDHLYRLSFRDDLGRPRVYYHYECEEGPYAEQVLVGDAGLPQGGVIQFLFDFGDRWRFTLRLERVDPSETAGAAPTVLEASGTPPKQYPDPE